MSQYDVAAAIAAANPLYVEILPWLPVKSLVWFRCVSSLKSSTSDPSFLNLHLQRSQKNASTLFKMSGSLKHCNVLENPSSTSTIVQPSKEHHIVGSCNGLIGYAGGDSPSNAHMLPFNHALPSYKKYLFYLWNPVTKS